MANKYTKDDVALKDKVFMLNGNSIVHSLEADNELNPIPSLKLVNEINDNIGERIDSVEDEIGNLSVDNSIVQGGFILSSLSQKDGLISYGTRKLADGDFDEELISQSKIKGLATDLLNISTDYLQKTDFNTALADSFVYDPEMKQNNDFRYDAKNHTIHLRVGGSKDMEIDMSEIVKGQIIRNVEVVDMSDGKYIKIEFDNVDIQPIYIRIDSFFNLYKSGRGIKINDKLSVMIDDDVVADKEYVDRKIDSIVSDSGSISGIIRKITQTSGVNEVTTGAITSSDFEFELDGGRYHNSIPVGYVDTLGERLGELENTDWRTLKFNGHIKNSMAISESNHLSDVFDHQIFDLEKMYNGSFIHVEFENGVISAKLKEEDLVFYDGDYLIIHDHRMGSKEIDKSTIEYGTNAFIIRSGSSKGEVLKLQSRVQELEGQVSELSTKFIELNSSVQVINGFLNNVNMMVK